MFFELGGREYSLIKNCAMCLNCQTAIFTMFPEHTASCECRLVSVSGGITMKASVQGPANMIKMLWVFIDRSGQTYTWEELVEVSQSGGHQKHL
jgi:hypothetical protein